MNRDIWVLPRAPARTCPLKRGNSNNSHVQVDDVADRLASSGLSILGIDHIGFNLPWQGNSLHPAMLDLRERLKATCLYHRFPSGEPWDFILPGSRTEISHRQRVDYALPRRPKFEIVSFDKCSTPLIQMEVLCSMRYEQFSHLFPEALMDPNVRNAWIYIKNDAGIDLCLVLNEESEGDWSSIFKGHRIMRDVKRHPDLPPFRHVKLTPLPSVCCS